MPGARLLACVFVLPVPVRQSRLTTPTTIYNASPAAELYRSASGCAFLLGQGTSFRVRMRPPSTVERIVEPEVSASRFRATRTAGVDPIVLGAVSPVGMDVFVKFQDVTVGG